MLRKLVKTVSPLLFLTALTGCVSADGLIRMPGLLIPTQSGSTQDKPPSPAVCSEIQIVHYNDGDPKVTVGIVAAALALPPLGNPLGHARNLLGDNSATIAQIQDNNAVLHRLCDAPTK